MTGAVIGWYAHHLGSGHVTTARLVGRLTRTPVVILSSASRPADWPSERWVDLPLDDALGGHDHTAGGALHWAPLGHPGYRDRMSAIAEWVRTARPAAMLTDVSLEVTLLARLLGVPVATMLMAGDRSDGPHQLAFDAASLLFAPFPAGPDVTRGRRPEWEAKTVWLGAMSRFDDRASVPPRGGRRVVMLWGHGGSTVTERDVQAAEAATPDWTWTRCAASDADQVWALLQSADVVVAHAGQSVVAEVAAARRPAVIVPQPRPHDEQRCLAAGLAELGLTPRLDGWPDPAAWATLLESAHRSDPGRWVAWSDGGGARRMAERLDQLAGEGAA